MALYVTLVVLYSVSVTGVAVRVTVLELVLVMVEVVIRVCVRTLRGSFISPKQSDQRKIFKHILALAGNCLSYRAYGCRRVFRDNDSVSGEGVGYE